MVHPQVADGDGLQLRRVAVDMLQKQLHTGNIGGLPALGFGMGLRTPQSKKFVICLKAP
jgi:hypothetical protein